MALEANLHFQNTSWLWMLVLLLPLAALFFYAQKRREQLLLKIVAVRLQESLIGRVSFVKRTIRALLVLVALGFLLIALARPYLGYEERSVPSHGRDVMIAIDTSRSMLATDVAPTRLARAKLLSQDVLELLPGDRVGLIAFAGKAFLQAPMTLDHSAVRDAVNELDTNVIPKGGTNIAEAIQLAMAALGKGEGTERALILMTDGEELDGNAIAAAKEAKERGIKIFTIGIGSPEGSLISIPTEHNGHDFVRDEKGKPVLSKLDVQRLQEIASITGGFYQPFGGDAAQTIVQKGILSLSGTDHQMQITRRPIERYEWPVGMALVLLMCWWLLDERRRPSRKLLFLLLLFFPTLGRTTPGLKEYEEGNYQGALQAFEEQLKDGKASDKARFDAGTAAYKQGEYKKAIEYFTGAMTSSSPAIQQAATYNLANALVREGEKTTEKTDKLSAWNSAIQHYDTVLKADPNDRQAKENQAIVKKLIEDFKKQEEQKKKEGKKNQNQEQQQDQQKNPQQNNQQQSGGQGSSSNPSQSPQNANPPQDQQKNGDQQPPMPDQQNPNNQEQNSSPQSASAPTPSSPENAAASPSPRPAESPSNQSGLGNENKPMPDQSERSGSSNQGAPTPTPQAQQTPNAASSPSPQEQQSPSSSLNRPTGSQKNNGGEKTAPSPTAEEKKQGALSGGEQKAQEIVSSQENADGSMSKAQAEAILRSMKDEEQQVQFQQRQESEETTRDW